MKRRATLSVERLEAKAALSGASAHLHTAVVGHGAMLHVEALPNPFVVSGTFTYYGSADRKVYLNAPREFELPKLGLVKIAGVDSGGKGDKVNATALIVSSRVGMVKVNLLPFVTFQPGVGGPYRRDYSFNAGGISGSGRVDFSLTGNHGFTFDFRPA